MTRPVDEWIGKKPESKIPARASMQPENTMIRQANRSLQNLLECWPCDLPDLRTPLERDADEEAEAARMSAEALDGGEK